MQTHVFWGNYTSPRGLVKKVERMELIAQTENDRVILERFYRDISSLPNTTTRTVYQCPPEPLIPGNNPSSPA